MYDETTALIDIKKVLKNYSQIDLLAGVGGLQLLPSLGKYVSKYYKIQPA
jgi:hypothetical protein